MSHIVRSLWTRHKHGNWTDDDDDFIGQNPYNGHAAWLFYTISFFVLGLIVLSIKSNLFPRNIEDYGLDQNPEIMYPGNRRRSIWKPEQELVSLPQEESTL
jgi:hypothetical protein